MKKNNLVKAGTILAVTSVIVVAGINSMRKESITVSTNPNSVYLNNTVIKSAKKTTGELKPSVNKEKILSPNSETTKNNKDNTLEPITKEFSLPVPNVKYAFVDIKGDKTYYEISIDNRLCGLECKNGITGWELYVTSEDNPGNEMIIDGIGYFLYSNNIKDNKAMIMTTFNKSHKYRARTYLDVNGKRIYSDFSEIITITTTLNPPTLDSQFINVENTHPTYDINIDYASYRIDDESYISGWKLYVTTDDNPGNEMIIDGVGYFFHSDNENESIRNIITSFNKTYKYRARVYIENEDGRIYSDFSDIMSISKDLKAPTLGIEYLETKDDISLYDVYIDYASYRVDQNEENYLSGWELYVTTDDNPGNEMIIDGVGYFLHSDNGNETIREVMVDRTRAYKYRARVYVEDEDGRIYSDYSDIMTIIGK